MIVTLLLVAFAAFQYREAWAVATILQAPSPEYRPEMPPAFVDDVLDVAAGGAVHRAWVLNPIAGEQEPLGGMPQGSESNAPRGTFLFLHGIRGQKAHLLELAERRSREGYRSVLVDLRGHGESSGTWLSYGVRESEDLVALIDALEARGSLARPLYVLGTSYGAGISLQYAARDSRVDGVIAISPFSSLEEVVGAYGDWIFGPQLASTFSIPDILEAVEEEGGFDPHAACPRCAAEHLDIPVLLIHSRDDERIPLAQCETIHAAAPRSNLVVVSGAGHNNTPGAREVEPAIQRWIRARAERAER